MLRTASSLPLTGPLTLGFDPTRFQTKPPACYRATWQLPGPDSHRQATTSLRTATTYIRQPPVLLDARKIEARRTDPVLRPPAKLRGLTRRGWLTSLRTLDREDRRARYRTAAQRAVRRSQREPSTEDTEEFVYPRCLRDADGYTRPGHAVPVDLLVTEDSIEEVGDATLGWGAITVVRCENTSSQVITMRDLTKPGSVTLPGCCSQASADMARYEARHRSCRERQRQCRWRTYGR